VAAPIHPGRAHEQERDQEEREERDEQAQLEEVHSANLVNDPP
jgi:hypothetical protein